MLNIGGLGWVRWICEFANPHPTRPPVKIKIQIDNPTQTNNP